MPARIVIIWMWAGVNRRAFSADGELLASGGRDDMIRIWEPRLGTEIAVLRGHDGDVFSVAFSPDGRLLASASEDGTVWLWRTSDGGEEAVDGPDDAVGKAAIGLEKVGVALVAAQAQAGGDVE